MDYGRIYRDFIIHRRALEPSIAGYAERHHILPRALGGGDTDENLIRLTPGDHFFAHLLLGKIHGGQMWAPVALMVGGQRRDWKPCRSRRAYEWAVREMAAARMGEGAYQFDHEIYELAHDCHRFWAGRQSDMADLGISRSLANMLLKGRVASAHGWYLRNRRPIHIGRGGRHGSSHAMADHSRYRFCHVDGRSFEGTQIEFREMSGASKAGSTRLVRGQQTITKGWHLDGVTPKTNGRAGAYKG